MHASVRWINQYLSPGDLTADEAADVLMHVGFPIETRTDIIDAEGNPDTTLDVEVTSNRGDCLSQIGLAREVAAKTGRAFIPPPASPLMESGGPVTDALALENRTPDVCPLFTARVIRGVKVGPSPTWLVRALQAVGQRSINNVVDVTNYLCFELGNPSHVFDLNKLAGRRLVVRYAVEGESLLTLDGKKRTLKADELVVADAQRAQSLAGVIGGGESEVSIATTDVVLEVATWDPVTVRRAARRLQVRTDASYRFERIVDPRTLEAASRRGAELIAQVAGGSVCAGVLNAGRPLPAEVTLTLRTDRCRDVLGVDLADERIAALLASQGFSPRPEAPGVLRCAVPAHRRDVHREIDLIEEVARTNGLDALPVGERLEVAVRPPQVDRLALREVGQVLTGLGFFEAVTFSFTTPALGKAFVPAGMEPVGVDDDRRGAEPTLRPSVLTGLLACRRANQDGQVEREGGLRLFEIAACYAQGRDGTGAARTAERRNVAMLLDYGTFGKPPSATDRQAGFRAVRGAVEHLVGALAGHGAALEFVPAAPHAPAFDASAYARVMLGGRPLGYAGLLAREHLTAMGLETPVAGGELELAGLIAAYPPRSRVEPLPTFPAVDRDLSPVLPENTTWARVAQLVRACALPRLESFAFVGTYRGKQLGSGKKSVTLRLRFRDQARTLRREEVDPEVESLSQRMKAELSAEFRTA